jgi:hypothetical protein
LGPWTAPIIGVAAAFLFFLIGWLLVGRRKRVQPIKPQYRTVPANPTPNPAEEDLFIRGSAMERRSSIRRRGNAVAILISDAEAAADPTSGWVVDRSLGGLCLSVEKEIESGMVLSVRTTNAPPEIPWVRVEVRSCRQVGHEYEIGCQFVRTPPWSVLLLFG